MVIIIYGNSNHINYIKISIEKHDRHLDIKNHSESDKTLLSKS